MSSPKPWRCQADESPLCDGSDDYQVIDAEDELVCYTHDELDARLIVAAPDLYAAFAEFVRKVECGEAHSTRSYKQMKAAIAKATEPTP